MFQKIFDYIKENHMIEAGDEVLVGVSGGADSVCLFFLLQKLQEKIPFHLTVMHINHSLRQTADRDEIFVKELCDKYKVDFVKQKVDVPLLVEEQGLSVEEAARIARYEAFAKQAESMEKDGANPVKLAVAHHINDQAETVLFHLFRGCSLTGLRGMMPVRTEEKFVIIRPLLGVTREEIQQFMDDNKLTYMMDETNLDNQYSRNRIRNEMLPMAEQFICQGTASHIAKTARDVTMAQDFLDTICQKEYQATVKIGEGTAQIQCCDFLKMHDYLKYEILYRTISQLVGAKKDLSRVHIESLIKLFDSQVGRQIDLPYGIGARRIYEGVELYQKDLRKKIRTEVQTETQIETQTETQTETQIEAQTEARTNAGIEARAEVLLQIPGSTSFQNEICINARVFHYDNTHEIPKNQYTKWFDYDKIKKSLIVRNRQKDDYFYIDECHKKKVKDYMVNEKIDRAIRDELLLVCEDNHMVWLPGYRISAFYKVSNETKRILELSCGQIKL